MLIFDKDDPLKQLYPILPFKITFSSEFDGVVLSMYFISYQSPIWMVFPSIWRGILICTSKMFVFGPVSIK